MPEMRLEISHKEHAELVTKANLTALTMNDYLRIRLGLPDEATSRQLRLEDQQEENRAQMDAISRTLRGR